MIRILVVLLALSGISSGLAALLAAGAPPAAAQSCRPPQCN